MIKTDQDWIDEDEEWEEPDFDGIKPVAFRIQVELEVELENGQYIDDDSDCWGIYNSYQEAKQAFMDLGARCT